MGGIRPTRLEGRALINVAGESHYQDALHAIAAKAKARPASKPQPPSSPSPPTRTTPTRSGWRSTASSSATCREQKAVAYGPLVKEPAERGRTAVCEAMVAGRGGVLGVFLKLPEVE